MIRQTVALLMLVGLAACGTPSAPTPAAQVLETRVLAPWQTTSDALSAGETGRRWSFLGQAGDQVTLDTAAALPVSAVLTDAGGAAVAAGEAIRVTLSTPGVFTLEIRRGENTPQDAKIAYTVYLTFANQPSPTASFTATTTPTSTPTATATPTASDTPSATATPTVTPTPTATASATATPPPTFTPTAVYADLGAFMGELPRGGRIESELISSFDRKVWLFTGVAGERATFAASALSGDVDPTLALYDARGDIIAGDDDAGGGRDARLSAITLPESGTYYVQVFTGEGAGRFTLIHSADALPTAVVTPSAAAPAATGLSTPVPAPSTRVLEDRQPALAALDRPGDVLRFVFTGMAGERYTIGAAPLEGSAVLPRIQLLNPAGEVLLEAQSLRENGGGALIPAIGVLENGVYTIFVTSDGDRTGPFTIAVGRGEAHTDYVRGPAPEGVDISGQVVQRGTSDRWTIDLAAGDSVRFQAAPVVSGFAPALELIGPEGSVLLRAPSRATGGRIDAAFTAARSGSYAVVFTGEDAGSFGGYAWSWERTPASSATGFSGTATLLLSAEDAIAANAYARYAFQGRTGDRIRVTVRALDGDLDGVAALLNSAGAALATADDSDGLDPILEITLPADGTYTLVVNGYNSTSGRARITIERFE